MAQKLDEIDIKLLATIEADGRITKLALAAKLNMSASACWERLNRLEKAHIIRGYHAEISVEKLAPLTTVLVEVVLRQHRHSDFQRFENVVKKIDEIVDCYSIGGGIDYILRVVTRDISSYQAIIEVLLLKDIGIERYYTYVVTRMVKSFPGIPICLATGALNGRRTVTKDVRRGSLRRAGPIVVS